MWSKGTTGEAKGQGLANSLPVHACACPCTGLLRGSCSLLASTAVRVAKLYSSLSGAVWKVLHVGSFTGAGCPCRLATASRKAVEGWGLELLCKDPRWYSDSLTVVEVPQVGPVFDSIVASPDFVGEAPHVGPVNSCCAVLVLTIAQQAGWTVRIVWAAVHSAALGAAAIRDCQLHVAADMCWSHACPVPSTQAFTMPRAAASDAQMQSGVHPICR